MEKEIEVKKDNKSNRKNVIIGSIVGVLLIGGGVTAYLLTRDNKSTTGSNSNKTSANTTNGNTTNQRGNFRGMNFLTGKISSIEENNTFILDTENDGSQHIIKVTSDTVVNEQKETTKADLLKANVSIMAIGKTTNGKFEVESISLNDNNFGGGQRPSGDTNNSSDRPTPPEGFDPNQAGGRNGNRNSMPQDDTRVMGTIKEIKDSSIIVTLRDNTEKEIYLTSTTKYYKTETIEYKSLKVGDTLTVNGSELGGNTQARTITKGKVMAIPQPIKTDTTNQ